MIYTIANRLGEIDWAGLKPGDTVRVPYRAEPYRERIVIGARGTADAWITVQGVPGPNGEKPVIDGQNAVTDPQFALAYPPVEGGGLVTVWKTLKTADRTPGYVTIDGFEIRNAYGDAATPSTFTAADGATKKWGATSGIYCLQCDHLTVRNCDVHDNGQGIFTADSNESNDVLIEGNRIWGNGVVGDDHYHGTYVQSARVTYRKNRYGPNRVGAKGGSLKDRSADVLIEGNTIEANARCIDLSAWQNVTGMRAGTPNALRTVIQGNTLVNRTGSVFVYLEGRTLPDGSRDDVRFLANTCVLRRDQSLSFYVKFFNAEYAASAAAKVLFDGNLIDALPATAAGKLPELRLFDSYGQLTLGKNWSRNPVSQYVLTTSGRTVAGNWSDTKVGGTDPGYANEAGGDYSLKPGAGATGFGTTATVVPLPPPPPVPPVVPPPPPVPPVVPPPPPAPTWSLVGEVPIESGDVRVVIQTFKRA